MIRRRHFIALAAALAGAAVTTVRAAGTNGPALKILVIGDSLSAEYGLKRGAGWVTLLQQRLNQEKIAVDVVNASVSGDTTAGGRSRLPALLRQHRPTHVIIELGGNDALRGLPLDMTERNLTEMTLASQQTGAQVLLLGMQVPPNYGRQYTTAFAAVFGKVARAQRTALVPFLLRGVAEKPDLFQPDRIHPNEAAHPIMLNNVWPALSALLKPKLNGNRVAS